MVRSRVLNPRWIDGMRKHGYKGAFELAATVDYLFGYDATTGVIEDWMYERVTDAYVADPAMRAFFQASNPTALTSTERPGATWASRSSRYRTAARSSDAGGGSPASRAASTTRAAS